MGFDEAAFDRDIKDVHLIYDYDAQNVKTGEPEKWKYEMWFYSKVSDSLFSRPPRTIIRVLLTIY